MEKKIFLLIIIFGLFLVSGCGQPVHQSGNLRNTPAALQSPAIQPQPDRSAVGGDAQAYQACDISDQATNSEEDEIDLSQIKDGKSSTNGNSSASIQAALDEALEFCQLSQDFWQKGELESAIDALDQAYALILSVDTSNSPKQMQQQEDLRFMISKRILEIYASRNVVLNGNHNEIPRPLNKHVQAEIDMFTHGKTKDFFLNAYKRSGFYREQILKELKAAGLPEELAWLPLIESGFKVKALSTARALGLWQFIPSTGYKFGLNRNKYIDERLDFEKSTKAAIEYLKELHQMFGDWATVLAAYNCGEGRVLQVIRNQNINYLDNFWDLYERLPRETARYVPQFLATLHIISNPEKYGMDLPKPEPALVYETITVSKQVNLKDIAVKVNAPEMELKALNTELRYGILPDEQYALRVPPGKGNMILAAIDNIPVSCPPVPASPTYVYHRVKSGETLSIIAKKYKSSVNKIMYANNMKRSNLVVAGKNLKIPLKGYAEYRPETSRGGHVDKISTYKVKSGDSLWIIAKRFQTTTKEIQNLNKLSNPRLIVGQVLKIPGDANSNAPTLSKKTYVVKRGDSPALIAKKNKMALSRLLDINRLTARCKIYPGQELYVE